jgi:hypothetical protein
MPHAHQHPRPPARRPPADPRNQDVLAWQDDPGSGLRPLPRPVPEPGRPPLSLDIVVAPAPPRPGEYPIATRAFRYWTAAEALRRAADFWAGLLPRGTRWWLGDTLPVHLDAGRDLNAYYDRSRLAFFHERVKGKTVYAGESPDILCHELGHAVLDAVRPQLFHTASLEVAAFHEAFGDISAILAALQLQDVRRAVIKETAGRYRSSRVSRLAEQLAAAIRQLRPDAVEADCLRNAVNSFVYRHPGSLPPWAPASHLSSEPHSLSRVFSAGFFEALCLMATRKGMPSESDLLGVTSQAGQLLVDAIQASPVTAGYFSTVASGMAEAAAGLDPAYPGLVRSAFARRRILPMRRRTSVEPQRPPLLALFAGEEGFADARIVVQHAGDSDDARMFLHWLIERGRLELDAARFPGVVHHPLALKTHRLATIDGGSEVVLHRIIFDCGFHANA